MDQSNKILLADNLSKWLELNDYSSELNHYKYRVKLDLSDTKELSSNIEQIMNFWVLPKHLNKELNKSQIIDVLITGKNEIPLWIGVEVNGTEIRLIISRRFKKIKVVRKWHGSSNTIPFVAKEALSIPPQWYKEFHYLHPAGMYENSALQCEEFEEICSLMVLPKISYEYIEEQLWSNVENQNAIILKINSIEYPDQYLLIDLWNRDQINVIDIYVRTSGALNDFIYRSLCRWNQRIWNQLGPKIEEIELGITGRLEERGRIIQEYII